MKFSRLHTLSLVSPRVESELSPDGSTFCVFKEDGTLVSFDTATGRARWHDRVTGTATGISINEAGTSLILCGCGESERELLEWELMSGKRTWKYSFEGASPDGIVYGPEHAAMAVTLTLDHEYSEALWGDDDLEVSRFTGGQRVLCILRKGETRPALTKLSSLMDIRHMVFSKPANSLLVAGYAGDGGAVECREFPRLNVISLFRRRGMEFWRISCQTSEQSCVTLDGSFRTISKWTLGKEAATATLKTEVGISDLCFLGQSGLVGLACDDGQLRVADFDKMRISEGFKVANAPLTSIASSQGAHPILCVASENEAWVFKYE